EKAAKGDKKSDKEFIQGDWVVESAIDSGMELPAEIRDMVKFHVKDDKIEIKFGEIAIKASYTVDETKKPKTVDLKVGEGMSALGIYEITKDNKVRFCMVDTEDKDKRPTEFKSPATSNTKLIVLKRPEKKDAAAPRQGDA